jgi:hypothetical protein
MWYDTLKYLVELFWDCLDCKPQEAPAVAERYATQYCSEQVIKALSQKRTPGSLRMPGVGGSCCLN